MDKTFEIVNGNCVDVLTKWHGSVDLVLTSPPYDDLRTYGGHQFDFDSVADALIPCLQEGGVLVWIVADAIRDGSETGTSFRQAIGFQERGLRLHQTLYYERARPAPISKNRCMRLIQYMFVFSNGKPKTANILRDRPNKKVYSRPGDDAGRRKLDEQGKNNRGYTWDVKSHGPRTVVWRYSAGWCQSTPKEETFCHAHPAIFPVRLAEDHIKTWTNEGDLVLDPMAGSGTTLRAAVSLNRRAVGIEIHQPYCDLMRKRMSLISQDMHLCRSIGF